VRAYHHGNLRRALLDAALDHLGKTGSTDFTLRELARTLGVTHNAPYRHFPGKAELLAALREEGFARLAAAERAALEGAPVGARERVRALGEVYVRFAIEEPTAFRLMMSDPVEGEPSRDETESFTLLRQALDAGRASGEARADLSSRELALAAWALVHGLASLLASGRLPGGPDRVRRMTQVLSSVFFDGVAPR
jgi:AcrR family transcriptional regulator